MAKTAPSTITLKGDPQGREGLCTDAAITPGMLLAVSAQPAGVSGMADSRILGVRPHNVESGAASAAFAREPDIFGGTIDTEYAVGDTVLYSEYRKGDMVYALLAAGNDVAVGALLESAGDGTLQAVTAGAQDGTTPFAVTFPGNAIARAMQAVDNDPGTGGAAVRIKVEVL